jgi:hypothetical protein
MNTKRPRKAKEQPEQPEQIKITTRRKRTPNKKTPEIEPEPDIVVEGLGDKVARFTKATGLDVIAKVWSDVTGLDCGCDERQEAMNSLFQRKKLKPRCITETEFISLKHLLNSFTVRLSKSKATKVADWYSTIFGTRYEYWCSDCAHIWDARIKELKQVLKIYEQAQAINTIPDGIVTES